MKQPENAECLWIIVEAMLGPLDLRKHLKDYISKAYIIHKDDESSLEALIADAISAWNRGYYSSAAGYIKAIHNFITRREREEEIVSSDEPIKPIEEETHKYTCFEDLRANTGCTAFLGMHRRRIQQVLEELPSLESISLEEHTAYNTNSAVVTTHIKFAGKYTLAKVVTEFVYITDGESLKEKS